MPLPVGQRLRFESTMALPGHGSWQGFSLFTHFLLSLRGDETIIKTKIWSICFRDKPGFEKEIEHGEKDNACYFRTKS